MADTFKIKIAGQTKEFESSLSNLNTAMKMLKSEGRSLDKALKVDPKNAEAAAKLYANLSQRLEITRRQAEETKSALSNIDPKVNLAGYVKAHNKLSDLETEATSLKQKLDSTLDKMHTLKIKVPKVDVSKVTEDVDSAASKSATSMSGKFKAALSNVIGIFSKIGESTARLSESIVSNFRSKLPSITSVFKTAGNSLVSAFKGPINSVGSMIHEVLIGGLRQVGSNIANSVGNGFKGIIGDMQNTQTAANGLKKVMEFAGLSKDYKALSDSLNKTAINTNISTQDADKFGSVLIGIGTNASKTAKIVDAAAKANQAFGGSGEAFSSVSLALGQIAASGKVTADNINQITDANSALGAALKKQVFDNYKKAGGTAASFNDAMAKSEISVDDLNTALIQVGDKGGTAITTLPDSMDSFKEAVGSKLQPAFDTISRSLARVVSDASDWVQNFNIDPLIAKITSFDFGAFFSNVGKAALGLFTTIQQVFSGISDAFETVTGKPLTLSNAFQAAADIIGKIVTTIADYASQIYKLLASAFESINLKNVIYMFTQLGNLIGGTVNTAVNILAGELKTLDFNAVINGIGNVARALKEILDFINNSGISSALGSIFGSLISAAASVGGHIAKAVGDIVKALQPAARAIKPAIDSITKVFDAVVKTIANVDDAVIDLIGKLISAFAKELGPGLDHFLSHLKPVAKGIAGAFDKVGKVFMWLADKVITPLLIPVFEKLGKIVDGFFDILGKVLDKVGKVVNAGRKIAKSVGKMFDGIFNSKSIDSEIKNYTSEVNNSSSTFNQDNVFNISGVSGMNLMQLARKISELQKAGMV